MVPESILKMLAVITMTLTTRPERNTMIIVCSTFANIWKVVSEIAAPS